MLKTNKAMVVIDMPGGCVSCPCCDAEMGYCTLIDDHPDCFEDINPSKERLPICPLIPVTEDMERYLEFYQERILGNMPKE